MYAYLLKYQTTTLLDHPTLSSIENLKRELRLPTKDITSTKNRLIFVQLLMVCELLTSYHRLRPVDVDDGVVHRRSRRRQQPVGDVHRQVECCRRDCCR